MSKNDDIIDNWPASDTATCVSLELDNDVSQFKIAFFFQMSQNTGAEEHFALTDSLEIWIQFKSFNLVSK